MSEKQITAGRQVHNRVIRIGKNPYINLTGALIAMLLVSIPVAAAPPQVPSTLEPTKPQQSLEEPVKPKSTPQLVVPLARESMAPEQASEVSFVFRELRLEGATMLDESRLVSLWTHKAGDEVIVRDVFDFANAVTRAYADADYALSFAVVPEQEIRDGIVVIRVVEGFVERIEVAGDESAEVDAVRRRVESTLAPLLAARPLKTAVMERYLLLANDLPGVKVRATLAPSPETLGGSILRLEIEQDTLNAEVTYNNYMPESLDRDVAGVTITLNNPYTGAQQLRIGGWQSLGSKAYWAASLDASTVIGLQGWRAGITASHSDSTPSDDLLTALEYNGQSTNASLWLSYPAIRARARNLTFNAEVAISNAESEMLGDALVRDKLRTAGISATYDFADATGAVTYTRLGLTRGLDKAGAEGNSRANGDVQYTLANLDLQRNQPFTRITSGELGATLSLQGQTTAGDTSLFSAAECGYGGRRFGRAYDSAEILGEECLNGSLELHWNGRIGEYGWGMYGFVDGGRVRQQGELQAGELRERTATSNGFGIRMSYSNRVTASVESAYQRKLPTGSTAEKDRRVNAAVTVRF